MVQLTCGSQETETQRWTRQKTFLSVILLKQDPDFIFLPLSKFTTIVLIHEKNDPTDEFEMSLSKHFFQAFELYSTSKQGLHRVAFGERLIFMTYHWLRACFTLSLI